MLTGEPIGLPEKRVEPTKDVTLTEVPTEVPIEGAPPVAEKKGSALIETRKNRLT